MPHRGSVVDKAKAARAKAAIKAAKSQSPKSVYKSRKWKAAVDLETPKSLLVNIRLKSLINLDTCKLLSRKEKERLVGLLPSCDQQKDRSGMPILNSAALTNEFFTKSCVEWCERLGDGEFLKDRQQGGDTWKVRQFGVVNGAKSHAIESLSIDTKVNRSDMPSASTAAPLLHLSRLKNGSASCVSVKLMSNSSYTALLPKRCRRQTANIHLQRLNLKDGASAMSETSSKSSLSVCDNRSRVRLSCPRYGGDSSSSATLGNNTGGQITQHMSMVKPDLDFFVHPALRDHDYVLPLRQFPAADCESRTSRIAAVRRRYRRRRGRRRRKHARAKKPDCAGVHTDKGPVLAIHDRGFYSPMELLMDRTGTALKTSVATSIDAKGDGKDDVANSQVLSLENTSFVSNTSVKSNGRLNGTCSPIRREHGHSVSVQQHLTDVAADNSWLKENDVNLNYVSRIKTIQHLRKCEQTDGMPLIQIQGSDLLSRLGCSKCDPSVKVSCNKDCQTVPSSVCFGKNNLRFNGCDVDVFASPVSDSQCAIMVSDVDEQLTGDSNSTLLQRADRSTELDVSDCRTKSDEKFFVRLVGIQRIPLSVGKSDGRDVIRSGESDSSLASSSFPPSVFQEVQHRGRLVEGGFPCVGQHCSSSSDLDERLGHSVEIPFPSDDIQSQVGHVVHASSRQTDTRENGLSSCKRVQNSKLIQDMGSHLPNCSTLDSSEECVWESVVRKKDTVKHCQ